MYTYENKRKINLNKNKKNKKSSGGGTLFSILFVYVLIIAEKYTGGEHCS